MDGSNNNQDNGLPPPENGVERHTLSAETELRLEVPWDNKICKITLQRGSCELWGLELALQIPYELHGGFKLALFTWHGCVLDVQATDKMGISYTSDETNANVAYVNTHAQLEVLRDDALQQQSEGPRVLIVGPPESGKSSLARVLVAYATKLGRCPLWVDIDPSDNAIGVPGSIGVAPIDQSALRVETMASTGLPPSSSTAAPLLLWYGHTTLSNPDLFRAQVSALSEKIDGRFQHDSDARASGFIVNTNGNIQEDGFQMLLHTVQALKISVILVMGHDRLYSMMNSKVNKETTKVIKLPRSGGVVSREAAFQRQQKSNSIKRYFYGGMVKGPTATAGTGGDSSTKQAAHHNKVPELTPFAVMIKFSEVSIYKFTSVSLSNNLLPMGATQSTEAVQITPVKDINEQLAHAVLAVVHPVALERYQTTGRASHLYESSVAGFVVVEKVLMDTETLHLLSPCAGSLPSTTFLAGDVSFME